MLVQNLIALTPVRTVVADADGRVATVTTDAVDTCRIEEEEEDAVDDAEEGNGSVAWAPNLAHAFFHLH
jgi:hypothetical protein